MSVRDIDFTPFYDFSILFWDCSDSEVYFGTVQIVRYILGLFRQWGIFWDCSDSEVYFGTVQTVRYILGLFRQCGIFLCLLFFIFRLIKCIRGIDFACDFNNFSIRFWNCSDSVVFFFTEDNHVENIQTWIILQPIAEVGGGNKR